MGILVNKSHAIHIPLRELVFQFWSDSGCFIILSVQYYPYAPFPSIFIEIPFVHHS